MSINPIKLSSLEEKKEGKIHKLISTIKYGLTERLFANEFFLVIFVIFSFLPAIILSVVVYYGATHYQFLFSLLQSIGNVGGGNGIDGGVLTTPQYLYVSLLYYTVYLSVLGDWTLITIIFGGIALTSEEYQAKTFQYYFSRPFSPQLYISGRFLSFLVALYPLVALPYIVGMGIPLISIPLLGESFSTLNLIGLLAGGLFSLFIILTIQIVMILAFTTILDKKFVLLVVMLFYYVSWGLSRFLLPHGEIFALFSYHFYLKSIIILLISMFPFGTTITGRTIPTGAVSIVTIGGVLGFLSLGVFATILLRRLHYFEL